MKNHLIDSKLKKLIQVCKETYNYKKLAVVSFILISNLLDEMSIKLGLRARNKEKGEKIYEFMKVINEIIETNVEVPLFQEDLINILKEIEPVFLKLKGDIPLEHIQKLFFLYYELRKIEVPSVYEGFELDNIFKAPPFRFFSFLSKSKAEIKRGNSKIKPLILYKIQEQENKMQRQLVNKFDKDSFKQVLYLKTLKKSLNDNNGKITIKGALKDNIYYANSVENVVKYAVIGCFLLFVLVGFVILTEMVFYPNLTFDLSPILLVCFCSNLLFILIHRNYRNKK